MNFSSLITPLASSCLFTNSRVNRFMFELCFVPILKLPHKVASQLDMQNLLIVSPTDFDFAISVTITEIFFFFFLNGMNQNSLCHAAPLAIYNVCAVFQLLPRPLLRLGRGGRSSGQQQRRQGEIVVASAQTALCMSER